MHVSVPRYSPALAVLAALLLAPHTISAQTAGVPDSGARVRVTTNPDAKPMEGTLVRWSADSLILALADADTARLVRTNVSEVAVSRGRHSQAGKGAVIGGVAGAAIGLAISVAASTEDCTSSFLCYEWGPEESVITTLAFAALGTGIGALIGLASHEEDWEVIAAADVNDPAGPAIRLGLRIEH